MIEIAAGIAGGVIAVIAYQLLIAFLDAVLDHSV